MDDRDERGRFLPGVTRKAGPGRPPRSVEEKTLASVVKAFSNGSLDSTLIEPWKKQCKRGDMKAIGLALAYLMGSPEQVLRLLGGGPNNELVWLNELRQAGTPDESRDTCGDP